MYTRRHLRERIGVEEMARTRGRRRGDHDVRGTRQQLVEGPHDMDTLDGTRRIRTPERAYVHTERERTGGDRRTDAAETDQGDCRALDAIESGNREIPVLRRLR